MDNRQKALDELKRRIKEQKARIDPRLLKLAESAAMGGAPAPGISVSAATVPFDRDAAARIVALFVKGHQSPRDFECRLAEFVLKNRH